LSPEELAAGAQPRIIAMSANALKEDYDVCLAAGMDDYLSKPVQVDDLVRALRKCGVSRSHAPEKSGKAAVPPTAEAAVEAPQAVVLDTRALELLRVTLGRQADQMLPTLIEQFYRDADRLLDQARQASKQGQAEDLRIASHSLKSLSATFGALALSAVAREMETLARDGRLEGVAEKIAEAVTEFAGARAALEAMRHEP
jgi:CheY-like chemotaxis protein